jgi:hypothetical protein
MKKQLFVVFVVIALLVAALPVSVFAGTPAELKVDVRNTTGGAINLDIVDAAGNHIYKSFEAGVFEFDMLEGVYTYYVSTPCGNYAGDWNLNINKTLFVSCKSGEPTITMDECVRGAFLPGGFVPAANLPRGHAASGQIGVTAQHFFIGCYYGLTPEDYSKGFPNIR